jgi:LysM repeat protein
VQRGDTLSDIAAKQGQMVATLMRLNDIGNPNTIYAGQLIRLR